MFTVFSTIHVKYKQLESNRIQINIQLSFCIWKKIKLIYKKIFSKTKNPHKKFKQNEKENTKTQNRRKHKTSQNIITYFSLLNYYII